MTADPRRPSPANDDNAQLAALLASGIGALKLALPGGAEARLLRYLAELRKWNAAYNLTAVRDARQGVIRHLLDSLAVLADPMLSAGTPLRMLDVGSGGGMPGIAFAIARPAWRLTLLDSNGKKARFLRHLQRSLELENVVVVEARAERWIPEQCFDCIVSRAFASLGDFVGWTDHLACQDGVWLAMKGRIDAAEASALPAAFRIESIRPVVVPKLDEARHLVVLRRSDPATPVAARIRTSEYQP